MNEPFQALRVRVAPVLARMAERQVVLGRALTAAEIVALAGAVSWSGAAAPSAGAAPQGRGSAQP